MRSSCTIISLALTLDFGSAGGSGLVCLGPIFTVEGVDDVEEVGDPVTA